MNAKKYLELLEEKKLLVSHNISEEIGNTEIKKIAYHTSEVCPGTLFFCKGSLFKAEYAIEALRCGAVALVCDREDITELVENAAYILVGDIRKAMCGIAAFHNNYPDRELFTIGITGTKGKTTSAFFIKNIIDDYSCAKEEKPCGIFSSIENYCGNERVISHLTTPESIDLFNGLRTASDSGIKYFVMEASSQGLKYNRVDKMHFSVGIFLNISNDHISSREHNSFEDYFESKMRLFSLCDKLIVNYDSQAFDEIEKKLLNREYLTFSIKDDRSDYFAYRIRSERDFMSFRVRTPFENTEDREFRIGMKGEFNISNALAAIAACDLAGIPTPSIQRGLMKTRVPGRMEFFSSNDGVLNAVVDYAHNKLSFENLFSSLEKEYPDKKAVAIFGCPGYKAYDRRKELPEIASKYCDYIYLTEEDPGREPLDDINREISENIPKGFPFEVENDREKAIIKAFDRFGKDHIIVMTGKGAECTQGRSSGYEPYKSDTRIVMDYLKSYDKKCGDC